MILQQEVFIVFNKELLQEKDFHHELIRKNRKDYFNGIIFLQKFTIVMNKLVKISKKIDSSYYLSYLTIHEGLANMIENILVLRREFDESSITNDKLEKKANELFLYLNPDKEEGLGSLSHSLEYYERNKNTKRDLQSFYRYFECVERISRYFYKERNYAVSIDILIDFILKSLINIKFEVLMEKSLSDAFNSKFSEVCLGYHNKSKKETLTFNDLSTDNEMEEEGLHYIVSAQEYFFRGNLIMSDIWYMHSLLSKILLKIISLYDFIEFKDLRNYFCDIGKNYEIKNLRIPSFFQVSS